MVVLLRSFILALLISAPVLAGDHPIQYFLTGGVAYPVFDKDLTRIYNAGLHLGIGLGYTLSEHAMVVGSVEVSNLPLDDEQYLKSIDANTGGNKAEEGSATVLTTSLNYKHSFAQARSGEAPFVTAGVTFSRFIAGDVLLSTNVENDVVQSVIDGKGRSAFGFNGGAGFNVHLSSKSFLFFEARYTLLFFDKPRVHFIPLQMGVAFR